MQRLVSYVLKCIRRREISGSILYIPHQPINYTHQFLRQPINTSHFGSLAQSISFYPNAVLFWHVSEQCTVKDKIDFLRLVAGFTLLKYHNFFLNYCYYSWPTAKILFFLSKAYERKFSDIGISVTTRKWRGILY